MGHILKIFISNWLRTRKFSQFLQAGKAVAFAFPHHGHAMLTLTGTFDRWGHAENLCSIWKLIYWKLKLTEFCVILWYLNFLFNGMYKMKYSCHQDSSVIHGWFFYWVLRNAPLVKVRRKSDFGWYRFQNELRLHSLCIGGKGAQDIFLKGRNSSYPLHAF